MEILKNDISKKPNSFENNKLINPDFEIDTDDDEEYDEEQLDEVGDEIDDETLEIINRIRFKNINNEQSSILKKIDIPNIKETIKKKPKKNNKNMSLQEFSKTCESEKITIKKFTSNRVEDKKKNENNTPFLKRHFNPRKPPFNFHRKNKTIDTPQLNNIQEFPELK
jgi:hypothetical protein